MVVQERDSTENAEQDAKEDIGQDSKETTLAAEAAGVLDPVSVVKTEGLQDGAKSADMSLDAESTKFPGLKVEVMPATVEADGAPTGGGEGQVDAKPVLGVLANEMGAKRSSSKDGAKTKASGKVTAQQ